MRMIVQKEGHQTEEDFREGNHKTLVIVVFMLFTRKPIVPRKMTTEMRTCLKMMSPYI